jgi:hypothetical protein
LQPQWKWDRASRSYGNYGNANQWTVNAGLTSLARESAQNSNDARFNDAPGELEYTFIRLTGEQKAAFEAAAGWHSGLLPHLDAMADAAGGAVTAGQIKAGVEAVRSNNALLLLKISDFGCRGLNGPEFPEDGVPTEEYGNFIKLCRLDLFSGKDEAAGGSFGLGKAVYWRFSRLQTVLFNSCLSANDAVGGMTTNRVFGVNQGVIHALDGATHQGRGYFGVPDEHGDIASMWSDPTTVRALHLDRDDTRPGTTALLLGFYDPDSPDRGLQGGHELVKLAGELRQGIEESFWPLLTRGRMKVSLRVVDDGDTLLDEVVDPEDTYTELVRALQRFDRGDLDETLDDPYSVVVRDIPIKISRRKDGVHDHEAFVHQAKLVVTASDAQADSLENNVCLLRRPEMVVQTIQRPFEGRAYHGFLLAGASIRPDAPTEQDMLADDFLRYAEPPAHDRWIPGSGRKQASQANLTGRYVAPWIPNLKGIESSVLDALFDLFGAPPPTENRGPEAVLKHLRFLRGEPGKGGRGVSAPRRPEIIVTDWKVIDDRWDVTFEIVARNQPTGWLIEPHLRFLGLDGRGHTVPWEEPLTVVSGGEMHGTTVRIPASERGRKLKAVIRGLSTDDLPIPAREAAIDVVVGRIHPSETQEADK